MVFRCGVPPRTSPRRGMPSAATATRGERETAVCRRRRARVFPSPGEHPEEERLVHVRSSYKEPPSLDRDSREVVVGRSRHETRRGVIFLKFITSQLFCYMNK